MMDLVCLVLGAVVGVTLRLGHEEIGEYVFGHIDGWILFFGAVLLANYLAGSYKLQYTFSRFNLVVTWLFSVVFALLILSLTSYAWFTIILGRGVLLYSVATYSLLSLVLKLGVYRSLFRNEVFLCRTVILGTGARAASIRELIEREYVLPVHRVIAALEIVDDTADETATRARDAGLEGVALARARPAELEKVVHGLDANLVIIGFDNIAEAARFYPQLKRLRFNGIEVLSPLNVAEIYSGRTPLDLINEEFLVQASMESSFPVVRRAKRLFDILISLGSLALFLPLGMLIALLIKLSAPRSPVLYRQKRVGQFGAVFTLSKFRTMREDAEHETGPVWAVAGDPRITRLGRFLRRFRLDEIPQLWNVLAGNMSLVGPRPERPEIIRDLTRNIPFYTERENVMPGVTGWAQIRYPYGSSVEDAARKLEYDLFYIKHLSLALDLQIMLRTLRIVLLGKEHTV
ncbi:MAG: exopolysaccharide biosynthesis polyprenyl glycosylphosphotransferase [Lentisphaerae bacterium]|nr:exopolysaccharide biosynthesis polyprenyl glycosylphosphotransferase [Lentisphaerota bacterium]